MLEHLVDLLARGDTLQDLLLLHLLKGPVEVELRPLAFLRDDIDHPRELLHDLHRDEETKSDSVSVVLLMVLVDSPEEPE